jgi:hypothetical protein
VRLRGMDVLLWKEEQKRPRDVPSKASHLANVGEYRCAGCEKVFYYRHGDSETPQYYSRGNKIYKDGFGRADPYCHRCWHKLGLRTNLSDSGCWLCDLEQAFEKGANGNVRNKKSMEKTYPLVGTQTVAPEQSTKKRKRRRNSRRTVLPD